MQKIILNNHIVLKDPFLKDEIKDIFTIKNPEYISICKQRRLSKNKQPKDYIITKYKEKGKWKSKKILEFLRYYETFKDDLIIPRGSFFELKKLYKKHKIKYKLINKRNTFKEQNFKFHGELLESKGQSAIKDFKAKNGIVQAPTGSGKSILALWLICKLNIPTIIVVHTNELLEQWKNRIKQFLKMNKIGHIGGGIIQINTITVALVQTLRNQPNLLGNFGTIVIDECHIAATESYGMVINEFNGPYVIGLSATPRRKDGKTKVMHWYLGEVKTLISYEKAERTPCIAYFMGTEFKLDKKSKISFQKTYSKALVLLTENDDRNKLIIDTVLKNIDFFGVHLILSQSSKHLITLMDMLPDHIKLISRLLVGSVAKKDRIEIVKLMSIGKVKFIFATDKLLGTGFDEPLLSVLHLTTPIKDPDRLTQYIGRITRIHGDKKKSKVFDYFDKYENILRSGASVRSKTYLSLSIEKRIG